MPTATQSIQAQIAALTEEKVKIETQINNLREQLQRDEVERFFRDNPDIQDSHVFWAGSGKTYYESIFDALAAILHSGVAWVEWCGLLFRREEVVRWNPKAGRNGLLRYDAKLGRYTLAK